MTTDRVPFARVGPEILRDPADVVHDHRVRGVEDRLGRAVVLLERCDRRVGECLFEFQEVPDVCAPPAVDRLVHVSDHRYVAVLGTDPHDELVLGPVRVLELVDENVGVKRLR